MKVALYEGVGKIKYVEREVPKAEAGQVLVKVTHCGICGTDIHAYMHEGILSPGTVPGHETVGLIEAIGEGVEGFEVGERVAVGAPGSCPEQCFYCRTGRPNLCVNGFTRTLGIGPDTQGAFGPYVLAEYPNRQLVKIPDSVSMEDAVLFDIFSTAYHGYKRSSLKAGDIALVVGAGAIGLSLIQVLKIAGAKKIICMDLSDEKLAMAKEFGADITINSSSTDDYEGTVIPMTDGYGADVVYECAGNPTTVGIAVNLCRPGGEVILIGTNPQPLSTINEIQIGLMERDLKGSFAYDDNEMRTVFSFMESKLITTEGMITQIIEPDSIDKALEELSKTTLPVRYVIKY